MSNPAVMFENVTKYYPLYHHIVNGFKSFLFNMPEALRQMRSTRFLALDGISFEVRRGEALGIIGRNGAGKSTMLALIAGVLKPTTGRVVVRGRILPLLELGGGFHYELTGRENILLNGILMGLTRAEVRSRMNDIVEFSELGEFVEQPLKTYSSGMLARLGFSVVAHLDPEVLLIDEILAVGDMEFQQKCVDKILGFKKSGVTIIFVSHSTDAVKMVCDRALWLENHRVQMSGDAGDVTSAYERSFG